MTALDAVAGRRSVRAFLPTPVERGTVRRILDIAARAPSGSNIQPWKVYAVAGDERAALSAELLAAHEAGEPEVPEYPYYPESWREPYIGRRRAVGWALYGALGIGKGERERTARQHGRNWLFFGAPVGLFFAIDRDMGKGAWLDLGMFMQNVMIAARGFGLETCPQAAFCYRHAITARHIGLPETEIIASGMALGVADWSAPENNFQTGREPAESFARFIGF
ncbi:nitroreductase [Azospirillum picis]|uniref:Nitroreductase n=1 Tax=Azospirillum picis TaxID=488438 RepID=A0ABU0MI92_9PROT|nr:nitroreductase [Azospirillum picis]MBP2299187.1 nitroreductase [Azospirillum picis]MDQ0533175.1 nitroreductase [Azospirillum picis]